MASITFVRWCVSASEHVLAASIVLLHRTLQWLMPSLMTSKICWEEPFSKLCSSGCKSLALSISYPQVNPASKPCNHVHAAVMAVSLLMFTAPLACTWHVWCKAHSTCHSSSAIQHATTFQREPLSDSLSKSVLLSSSMQAGGQYFEVSAAPCSNMSTTGSQCVPNPCQVSWTRRDAYLCSSVSRFCAASLTS